MASDEVESSIAELARVAALTRELALRAGGSASAAELFATAFPALCRCLPFDVGAAVMIEQHLDLYLSTRAGAHSLVNENLVARVRSVLAAQIPVSFETTEVVVKGERADLPAGPAGLEHQTFILIRQENRTAGLLLLWRAGAPFRDEDCQILEIFSVHLSMLLQIIRADEQLDSLADTDDLTGMRNKRFFRRQLPQEIDRARAYGVPLSLLFFDIDDFKQINDSHGHMFGDVVLSELCGAVREMLRPTDFLTRFGGDEFAVILPHTDIEGAVAVAERMLATVTGVIIPTDEEAAVRCSISIGVAEFSSEFTDADDFVRRADDKLYQSKRQGKNRYTA